MAQHVDEFIPSAENQEVLEMLEGKVVVEWLMHVGLEWGEGRVGEFGVGDGEGKGGGIGIGIGIVRFFVREGGREGFTEAFERRERELRGIGIGGGWRIDREGGREEFVLFEAWREGEEREGPLERYGVVREWVEGVEVKHARLMEV